MTYLLTPTGGRPESLALLCGYVNRQTYTGEAKWLIVDDCDPSSPIPDCRFDVEVIRPDWRWWPGNNTQAQSMAAMLDRVPDDGTVIVLEDDDYYSPWHVEVLLKALEAHELVGERESRYYNVASGRYRTLSGQHASMASTGARGDALAALKRICADGRAPLDIRLWRGFKGPKTLLHTRNVIGIKGMPGRGGIGVGHKPDFGQLDTTGKLNQWLGNDAQAYEPYRGTQ